MAWSIQIGRAFGIPIRLHLTFLLLLGWMAFLGLPVLLLAIGLFACVVLHELGHATVARRYGIEVKDITLLPIGGLARMATMPREPHKELVIAIAGPTVSFLLAPLFYGLHLAFEPQTGMALGRGGLLGQLAVLNLSLALFNLLPAFPMDGGRILRALLGMRMSFVRATKIAASVGQLFALLLGFVGLGFLGLPPNALLIFIALFIFIGAAEEGARAQTISFTEGVPAEAAMMTRFFTLGRGDTVGKAVDLLLAGTQQDFPVLEDGHMAGMLTRRRLLEALSSSGRDTYVGEVMEPAPEPVSPDTPLENIMERMTSEGITAVPVQTPQGLIGLLTMDNTMEFVLVRAAEGRNGAPRQRAVV